MIEEEQPHKRKEILNKGAIPEFVRVTDLPEVYRLFTEAQQKNKALM